MGAHLYEWLGLAVRWLHVVAGITWIGESFYFMWLDASLERRPDTPEGVQGESWSVHGGGFYRVIKFAVAPAAMPERLHWFRWEAYTTWLSGFALLVLVYWLQAEAWMLDAGASQLSAGEAVALAAVVVFGGWGVYTTLCRSPLGRRPALLAAVLAGVLAGTAWGLSELLAPRAAYIHVGAMIGTWMVGNVALVIIPNQKKVVATLQAGQKPDPEYGRVAKLRSTHNNYLTLPVIFVMISNHYPSTYGNEHGWAILLGLFAVGALARVFFNFKNAGRVLGWVLPAAAVGFLGLAVVSAPRPAPPRADAPAVSWGEVEAIVARHCRSCHSASPTDEVFRQAPLGVMYDTPEQVKAKAASIRARAVDTPTMPLGNKTGMTEQERATLGAWIAAGAPIPGE